MAALLPAIGEKRQAAASHGLGGRGDIRHRPGQPVHECYKRSTYDTTKYKQDRSRLHSAFPRSPAPCEVAPDRQLRPLFGHSPKGNRSTVVSLLKTNTAFVDPLSGHNRPERLWKAEKSKPYSCTRVSPDARDKDTFWLMPCNAIEVDGSHRDACRLPGLPAAKRERSLIKRCTHRGRQLPHATAHECIHACIQSNMAG